MEDKRMHLNEDQILLSLVDEMDLSEHTKSHLQVCPVCQEKKTALMSELERMGEMAKHFTPLPQQKPMLPLRESWHFRFRLPIFAAGLAVILLIAFLGSMSLFTDSSKQMTSRLSTEREADLPLMDDLLEEFAMPEYYLDIAVDSSGYFDDEFLKFVVPLEEQLDSV